jgi:hypothetical protein
MPAEFWSFLRIYCHVPSWASQLQLLLYAPLGSMLFVLHVNIVFVAY